jgi:hypothetical protein
MENWEWCESEILEGHLIGTTSLAITYWSLYVINEQQGKTVSEVWDGVNLKPTFRRTVYEHVMNLWWELFRGLNYLDLHIIREVYCSDFVCCSQFQGSYPSVCQLHLEIEYTTKGSVPSMASVK